MIKEIWKGVKEGWKHWGKGTRVTTLLGIGTAMVFGIVASIDWMINWKNTKERKGLIRLKDEGKERDVWRICSDAEQIFVRNFEWESSGNKMIVEDLGEFGKEMLEKDSSIGKNDWIKGVMVVTEKK